MPMGSNPLPLPSSPPPPLPSPPSQLAPPQPLLPPPVAAGSAASAAGGRAVVAGWFCTTCCSCHVPLPTVAGVDAASATDATGLAARPETVAEGCPRLAAASLGSACKRCRCECTPSDSHVLGTRGWPLLRQLRCAHGFATAVLLLVLEQPRPGRGAGAILPRPGSEALGCLGCRRLSGCCLLEGCQHPVDLL